MNILVIDNYDSFTFNLVQYLMSLGAKVEVKRNDRISVEEALSLKPGGILLSPGPREPKDSGITLEIIRCLGARIPILGVCLGHQAIGYSFGAGIVKADKVMHGKISLIHHNNKGIFEGIQNPAPMIRYNSLVICPNTMPASLKVTAWTEDGEIMGIAHRDYALEGIQFHPESILSSQGHQILNNWISRVRVSPSAR